MQNSRIEEFSLSFDEFLTLFELQAQQADFDNQPRSKTESRLFAIDTLIKIGIASDLWPVIGHKPGTISFTSKDLLNSFFIEQGFTRISESELGGQSERYIFLDDVRVTVGSFCDYLFNVYDFHSTEEEDWLTDLRITWTSILEEHWPRAARELKRRLSIASEKHENFPQIIEHLQLLLDGNHPCQAHELKIAIQAWFGAAYAYENGHAQTNPKVDIREWIEDHEEDTSVLSERAKARIEVIANWEKAGGNKTRKY